MALTLQKVVDNTLLFLRDRKTAYQLKFGNKDGATRLIMADLVKFTHWREGAFHKDQRVTDRLLGRQDVLRRINEHIGLTDRQLMVLYNGGQVPDLIEEEQDDR
jgi:hypothetical protein